MIKRGYPVFVVGMQASETENEVIGGRYVVDRQLGRGGVGEVLLAWDGHLSRWTAIKRLHSDTKASALRVEAAMQEAKTLASLQHLNVVTVYDFVREADDLVVVMEYVQGRSLEDLGAPLTLEDFVDVARQSLEGLGAAHALGMIHRDIKPSTIMIADIAGGKFQTKLLDFGLAKIILEPTLQTMDHHGSLLGSIYTMAPEQLEHRPLDARTDLYSLGCSLYWALTLRNSFEGDSIPAIITAHLQHRVEPLAPLRPDVPEPICQWVERLFSYEMERRPASARDAALQLQGLLGFGFTQPIPTTPIISTTPSAPVLQMTAPRPPKTSWVVPAVVAGAILAGAIAGVGIWKSQGHQSSSPAAASTPEADTTPPANTPPLPAPQALTETDPQAGQLIFSASEKEKILEQIGKEITVEGTISRAGENKSGTIRYLNFAGTQRGDLSLVFFLEGWQGGLTSEMLEAYLGKKVRVSGRVSEYQGNPQLVITEFSQIHTGD